MYNYKYQLDVYIQIYLLEEQLSPSGYWATPSIYMYFIAYVCLATSFILFFLHDHVAMFCTHYASMHIHMYCRISLIQSTTSSRR